MSTTRFNRSAACCENGSIVSADGPQNHHDETYFCLFSPLRTTRHALTRAAQRAIAAPRAIQTYHASERSQFRAVGLRTTKRKEGTYGITPCDGDDPVGVALDVASYDGNEDDIDEEDDR